MIDFKQLVASHRDAMIKDIEDLIKIPSVHDEDTIGENAPFGKNCRVALDAMLAIAKRDGYPSLDVEGYAGHVDIGEGEKTFAILGHLDVVPVDKDGWDTDPFTPTTIDGRMYGRGTADDKGPLVAGYYAAKIIDSLNLDTKYKTRVIFGCNEELGSSCVKYYFTKQPFPEAGFTPDGGFPVVYGEKSGTHASLLGDFNDEKIISMHAGTRSNVVSDKCVVQLNGKLENYETSFNAFLEQNKMQGTISCQDDITTLTLLGKAAHASTPELGVNAITFMANYLMTITTNPIIHFVGGKLNEYYGKNLGVDHIGAMGPLTLNVGVISIENGKFTVVIDMRCPHDMDFDHLRSTYQNFCDENNYTLDLEIGEALFIDPNSDLIQDLHNAYVAVSKDTTPPQTIGGGTYAKTMPNCVAFGPEFVGEDNMIHQNNESISIDSLLQATEIYVRALYSIYTK